MKRSLALFVAAVIAVATTSSPGQTPVATGPASRAATRPATPEEVARVKRLGKRDAGAHDPSTIVRDGDWYYCFVTGIGIGVTRSRDLQTWTPLPPVFARAPAWVAEAVPGNRGHFWAPDIIRGTDGRWWLYYSVSTFGKNTSAIALATNKTLDPSSPDFAWRDEGIVAKSSRADHFNAIDPAITFDGDGRLWMAFGSFWDGIQLLELDAKTGKPTGAARPKTIARNREIEAAFIYHHDDYYYLFVNWGLCCRGIKSTYEIRVGRAKSIEGPYLDRDGKEMAQGGGTRFFASDAPLIGPGHAGIVRDANGQEQFSFHFYDGTSDGGPMLGIRPLSWDASGWPMLMNAD